MNDALRDIYGIDAVSWWPLAPGWWLVAIGTLILLSLLKSLWPGIRSWYRRPRDKWRKDAKRQLHNLRGQLNKSSSKSLAGELSELIRRIAVARCGRDSCAGLSGQEWLEWLTSNDPRGFDWATNGKLLQDLAYAPPDDGDHHLKLGDIINASLGWASAPACSATSMRKGDV